jgi:outer membrane biosynthesis protein TonB
VDRVAVTTSSGFPAYDEKLQREIKAWRFRPIAIDGHQVSVCSALEFKGRLRAAGE